MNEEKFERESWTLILEKMCDETLNHFKDSLSDDEKKSIENYKSRLKEINEKIQSYLENITKDLSEPGANVIEEFTNLMLVEPQLYCVLSLMRTEVPVEDILNIIDNIIQFIENTFETKYKDIIVDVVELVKIYEDKKCDQCDEYVELSKTISSKLKEYSIYLKEKLAKDIIGKYNDKEGLQDKVIEARAALVSFNLDTVEDEIVIDITRLFEEHSADNEAISDGFADMLSKIQDILPTEEEIEFYKKNPSVGRSKLKAKLKNIVGGPVQEDFVDQMWLMIMQLSEIKDISQLKDIIGDFDMNEELDIDLSELGLDDKKDN